MPVGPESINPAIESRQVEGAVTKGRHLGKELEGIAVEEDQPVRADLAPVHRDGLDDYQYMGPIPPDKPDLPEDDPEYEAAWREYQEEYKEYLAEIDQDQDSDSDEDEDS